MQHEIDELRYQLEQLKNRADTTDQLLSVLIIIFCVYEYFWS